MKHLVLDANILIGAVLGKRVINLLEQYGSNVLFYAPDTAIAETSKNIDALIPKRRLAVQSTIEMRRVLFDVLQVVVEADYSVLEKPARHRIASRDANDWPVLATAMLLNCPIWTEDHDFFGTGVATWTTRNVEMYLRGED